MMGIIISEGTLNEALLVLQSLPEFDPLRAPDYYHRSLASGKSNILIAKDKDTPIACKIGYDRFNDGSFYSWLGGVLPDYRQTGIAQALADAQEQWARSQGYKSIKFKTQNRHRAMLLFAIKNGFSIYNVKAKDEIDLYRIELIKKL